MSCPPPTYADSLHLSRVIVGVADVAASADASMRLVTFALGSCLGITVYDPVAKVGAMLHVMLPDSALHRSRAETNPAVFVDTGVPLLFREAYRLGAVKHRLVIKVAGGASARSGSDLFEIGRRNMFALREVLWKNGVAITGHAVGGFAPRTITLNIATGNVLLRTGATDTVL
ncbi:MAG: chemotaxis protein CheD [bacterium]